MFYRNRSGEILNFNSEERLDDHPFILGLPAFRINGVPFSLHAFLKFIFKICLKRETNLMQACLANQLQVIMPS